MAVEKTKIEVAKVTTVDSRVFFTRALDRSVLMTLPGVQRVEDAWMTEEEYNTLPATDEARDFFSGAENVRGRAS